MDSLDLKFPAQRLAHTVIMSLKDEARVKGWLEANKILPTMEDKVVDSAMQIIRETLRDEHFSLHEYKSKHSRTCNR